MQVIRILILNFILFRLICRFDEFIQILLMVDQLIRILY